MVPTLIFGRGTHSSFGVRVDPTPPREGPARHAVLVHNGRRVLISRVLECCEYGCAHDMHGATVTCLGPRAEGEPVQPCAVIEAFDLFAVISKQEVHSGHAPSIGLDEAQLLMR